MREQQEKENHRERQRRKRKEKREKREERKRDPCGLAGSAALFSLGPSPKLFYTIRQGQLSATGKNSIPVKMPLRGSKSNYPTAITGGECHRPLNVHRLIPLNTSTFLNNACGYN